MAKLTLIWYDNFGKNQTPLQRNGMAAIPKMVSAITTEHITFKIFFICKNGNCFYVVSQIFSNSWTNSGLEKNVCYDSFRKQAWSNCKSKLFICTEWVFWRENFATAFIFCQIDAAWQKAEKNIWMTTFRPKDTEKSKGCRKRFI